MTASRKAIVRGFDAALQAADPVSAVCERISLRADGGADIAGLAVPAATPIEALAIGKAAARMMLGVVNVLGDRLDRGFVLTKDGHTSDLLPSSIRQVVAAHMQYPVVVAIIDLVSARSKSRAGCNRKIVAVDAWFGGSGAAHEARCRAGKPCLQ